MEKMPFAEARLLCIDPYSGFKLISGEQHIALAPRFIGNFSLGVREVLDSKIGYFSRKQGGTIISYSNIKLVGDKARIIDDGPYIHFNIQADFVLFDPNVGSCLSGVVNKVGKDHVGLLVHNHFNVSVPLNGEEEVVVSKGNACLFTVAHLYTLNNLLSMRGKDLRLSLTN